MRINDDRVTSILGHRLKGSIASRTGHPCAMADAVVQARNDGFSILAGVFAAIGHHLFYNSLDGKPADDQLKKVRYAALTAELRTTYLETRCSSLATINFTREGDYDFRTSSPPGFSLAFYNSTDVDGVQEDWFDYYDQPSKNARRLALTSVYLRRPGSHPDAAFNACGEGWNCTYELYFRGPGYKCDQVANGDEDSLDLKDAPFDTRELAPRGKAIYKAAVDLNDYANPQIETGTDGQPKQGPPYPDLLGVLQSEPVLWIGYSANTSVPYEKSSSYAETWVNVHEPKILKCVLHHTDYVFDIHYTDQIQEPLIDIYVREDPNKPGSFVSSPSINYIRPDIDPPAYKIAAAYHALGSLLRDFLRGEIIYTHYYKLTMSDISQSRLLDPVTSYPVPDFGEAIQGMFEDMLITLLSEPNLEVSHTMSAPCRKSRTTNVYVYHWEGLWAGYTTAVCISFLFLLVGAWSMYQNGVASDTAFSRIVVTTRNPMLDRLSSGACLGNVLKELKETKLRFGHCCYGTAEEVKSIVNKGKYAGLRARQPGSSREKEALLRSGGHNEML
ncbi:hypothetical protein M011DRAFT_496378 [Sporormia fimetaria CBS 119925]|uniref:Uncharacterized protein n=1 Tax=Sporormia fimetaria CBS 119925 TaxID=1340428 RepID=A0A6A6V4R2_9PLEO|nr:hypothetical protein M011DRAFT_496378 [Sporormia fimetaria CBS 119925]